MTKEKLQELLKKYQEGNCSESECTELDDWFHELNYADVNFERWIREAGGEERVADQMYSDFRSKYAKPGRVVRFRWLYRAAAAILLITAAGMGYSYYKSQTRSNIGRLSKNEDLAPGGNKALLTLSNGQKISLTGAANGTLATQQGVSILKTADGQLIYKITGTNRPVTEKPANNTIETPRGGQYQIVLPDGTKVWLNALSSLSYPAAFAGKAERRVTLKGEAYFEVAKMGTESPFVVLSNQQELKVLGTHFNIEAYGALVKTTLLEGSVNIRRLNRQNFANQTEQTINLVPGQQSSLNPNGNVSLVQVDPNDAVAWKEGYFMFKNESLESIMEKISRWYNVEVVFKNEDIKQVLFWGTVSRSSSVSGVLKVLERTGEAEFRIEGNKIIVMN